MYRSSGDGNFLCRNTCGSACGLACKFVVILVCTIQCKAGEGYSLVIPRIFVVVPGCARLNGEVITAYLVIYGSIVCDGCSIAAIVNLGLLYRSSGDGNFLCRNTCLSAYRLFLKDIVACIVTLKFYVHGDCFIITNILVVKYSAYNLGVHIVIVQHTAL